MTKILFSSPTSSGFVEELFESDEILHMPKESRRSIGRKECYDQDFGYKNALDEFLKE